MMASDKRRDRPDIRAQLTGSFAPTPIGISQGKSSLRADVIAARLVETRAITKSVCVIAELVQSLAERVCINAS
jgi:hypothetical protein